MGQRVAFGDPDAQLMVLVSFADTAGARWWRQPDGRLAEVRPSRPYLPVEAIVHAHNDRHRRTKLPYA